MADEPKRPLEKTKSYADKLLETLPMWHFMGLDGLDGFEKKFEVKLASVQVAREKAKVAGCTRMKVVGEKEVVEAKGKGGGTIKNLLVAGLTPFKIPSIFTVSNRSAVILCSTRMDAS